MTHFKAVVFLIALFSLSSVQALTCYEKSPNYIALGDAYFDVEDNLILTSQDEKAAKSLLKTLKGKWRGHIVETECTGPDRSPEEKTKQIDVKAKWFTSSTSLLALNLNKKYLEGEDVKIGYTKGGKLELLNKDTIFDFTISGNQINATEKQRRNFDDRSNSRLVEIFSSIIVGENSVMIELTHYSNGVYVLKQLINLEKN